MEPLVFVALVLCGGLAVAVAVVAVPRWRATPDVDATDPGHAVRALTAVQSPAELPAAATAALIEVPGVVGAAWLHATAAHLHVTAAEGQLASLTNGIATAPLATLPRDGEVATLSAAHARTLLRPIDPALPDRPLTLIGVGGDAALAAVHTGDSLAHLTAVGLLAATVDERTALGVNLRQARRRTRALADGGADLTLVVGSAGRIVDADGPIAHHGGGLRGRRLLDAIHPGDHAVAVRLIHPDEPSGLTRGEVRVGADGSWRVLDVVASDLRDDPEVRGMVLAGRDVTARAATQRELAQRAWHDPLTGLPNRSAFQQRLRRALDRHGARVGVLFIDLDAFKPINDTYGHAVGDTALCVVARRLESVIRDEDVVARLAGDEFAALTVGVDDPATLRALAQRLIEAVNQPASLPDGVTLELRASVGGAVASGQVADPATLLDAADQAMYVAKRGGDAGAVINVVGASTELPARLQALDPA